MQPGLFSRFQPSPADSPADRVLYKYRLGLVIILLFSVAVAATALVMAGGAKQDAKTQSAAQKAASTLEDYVYNNQQIPGSLAAAGVKDVPDTISYKRLSDSSYQFCVTYHAPSNAGSSVSDVVSRGFSGVEHGANDNAPNANAAYLDVGSPHKKGKNCQTVTPFMDGSLGSSPSAGGTDSGSTGNAGSTGDSGSAGTGGTGSGSAGSASGSAADPKSDAAKLGAKDTVCGVQGSFGTHYSGVVQSVTTSDDPADDTVSITVTPTGGTVSGDQTFTFSSTSFNVFDSSCASTQASSFYQGDYISVFQNNKSGAKDTVVNSSL